MSPSFSFRHEISGPAGESNPDLLGANQASFRWTSRPSFSITRLPRSARDSNPVHLPTKEACRHEHLRTDQVIESSRQDSNLREPVCKTGALAAGRRDDEGVSQ